MICPKCNANSGDDWVQCEGKCPLPHSPHYDWQTEMNFKVRNKCNPHSGKGYNMRTPAARKDTVWREKMIQRLKPVIEELIENSRVNGYWEETKKQSYARIAAEMQDYTDVVEHVTRRDIILVLRRIKMDNIHW